MHLRSRTLLLIGLVMGWSLATAVLGTALLALVVVPWFGDDAGAYVDLLQWWWTEPTYWIHLAVIVPVLVGTQVLFLLPIAPMEFHVGKPRSLRCTIVLAGLVAAILTLACAMSVVALVQLIFGWLDDFGMALFVGPHGAAMADPELYAEWAFLIPLVCLLASWLLWSMAIGVFMRRGQPVDRVRRLVGVLFAGTLIELVLILPLEAMVRRRADCYCATGSFQGLVGGCIAALWLLGPMACVILIKRRPGWWARHCQRCGYDKTASSGDRCPECGWGWNVDEAQRGR